MTNKEIIKQIEDSYKNTVKNLAEKRDDCFIIESNNILFKVQLRPLSYLKDIVSEHYFEKQTKTHLYKLRNIEHLKELLSEMNAYDVNDKKLISLFVKEGLDKTDPFYLQVDTFIGIRE